MSMNPGQFLLNLNRIVTGHGYKRVIQGISINTLRLTTGAILAADTGHPQRGSLETYFEGVVQDASQTTLGTLTFMVPRDYDASIDKLHIRFLANSAGDTNTPTIDAAIYRKRAEAALSSDIDPTISGAVNNNTAKADWVEIVSEGDGWLPGDAVTLIFTTSAHTTDALHVYGLEVVYASDLVYYEDDERSISDE